MREKPGIRRRQHHAVQLFHGGHRSVRESFFGKPGGLLEREGYEVRVFDLINPETSFCYNPFAYVRDDKDVLKLINNLIRNTTRRGRRVQIRFGRKVRLPCCSAHAVSSA